MNVSAASASGSRRLPLLALGLGLGVLVSSTAWAQMMGNSPIGTSHIGRVPPNANKQTTEPSPDAIPGAKPREPAAPATRPAGDLAPTEALFDAINRGDIVSVRDALSRGADLNGVNVLGMTPMELSVDLGRNDISFLLLSMRGEDPGRGSRAVGRDSPAYAPGATTAQAAKPAKGARVASGSKAATGKVARAGNSIIPAKPVATPKLFANDGGAPAPSAGFLGFDSRSASN